MRLKYYLKEGVIDTALELPEPEVNRKYNEEEIDYYINMIETALAEIKMKGGDGDLEQVNAIKNDLEDKLEKWKNVDKETEPAEPPPAVGAGEEDEEEI